MGDGVKAVGPSLADGVGAGVSTVGVGVGSTVGIGEGKGEGDSVGAVIVGTGVGSTEADGTTNSVAEGVGVDSFDCEEVPPSVSGTTVGRDSIAGAFVATAAKGGGVKRLPDFGDS